MSCYLKKKKNPASFLFTSSVNSVSKCEATTIFKHVLIVVDSRNNDNLIQTIISEIEKILEKYIDIYHEIYICDINYYTTGSF